VTDSALRGGQRELKHEGSEYRPESQIDGQAEGSRPRDVAPISMDEITVGARCYNNGTGPQRVDGFGRVDVAEILVYDRALTRARPRTCVNTSMPDTV